MRYRGEKKNSKVRIFYGGKGTTTIKLIETSGDKNIYDRFYEKHGEAVHHVMYMTKDLDKTVRVAVTAIRIRTYLHSVTAMVNPPGLGPKIIQTQRQRSPVQTTVNTLIP